MFKLLRICTAASLLFLSCFQLGYAQEWQAYDLDTTENRWTALSVQPYPLTGSIAHFFAVAGLDTRFPVQQATGEAVGTLSIKFYRKPNDQQAPWRLNSLVIPGNARINSMSWSGMDLIIGGVFLDTLVLGTDTFINPEQFALDAFLAKITMSGDILWSWHGRAWQNNTIQRIRYRETTDSWVAACGLGSDVDGWMGLFDPFNGNLVWSKDLTQIRTVSDLGFAADTAQYPGLWFCGSADPAGGIDGVPLPPSLPLTGYQNYLGKIFPFRQDSVQLLKTISYITFDFESQLEFPVGGSPLWSATGHTQVGGQAYEQSIFELPASGSLVTLRDSFSHQGRFLLIPGRQDFPQGMTPQGNLVIYTPHTAPGQYNLDRVNQPLDGSFQFGTSLGDQWLGTLADHQLYLAAEVPSQLTYQGDIPQSITFSTFSSQERRWVLFYRSNTATSLETTGELSGFELFPNPVVSRQLNVRFPENSPALTRWVLRDLQGKTVQEGLFSEPETTLSLEKIQSGLYIMELNRGNQKAFRKVVLP